MDGLYRYLNVIAYKRDRYRLRREKKQNLSFVAMFHNVVADEGEIGGDPYAITVENLTRFLDACGERGYTFASVEDVFCSGADRSKNRVVMTFDDGFESIYTLVDPLLRSRNIPYTVFETTENLGKAGYLTAPMLREIAESPVAAVGMHADRHLMYRYESDACLMRNYERCCARIEEITGKRPVHFAFPYGSMYAVSRRNMKTVKKLGAKTVFLTRQHKLNAKEIRLADAIPRLNVPGWYNKTEKVAGIEL